MTNLVQFPDPRKVMREASLWLVRMEEELAEDERRQLDQWLAADPRHPKALVRLAEVWETFDVLSELAEIFPIDRYRSRRARPFLLRAGAVTATAASIAALGWYLVSELDAPPIPNAIPVALPEWRGANAPNGTEASGSSRISYETKIGEQLSARLPDGSVVTLNTDTLLDVAYSDSERLVTIRRGEASFNVTRDAARPFRVLARTRIVQALGTIFNVHLDARDRVEVTVSEGRVRVTLVDRPASPSPPGATMPEATEPPDTDMTVAAGQVAVIDGAQGAVRRVDTLEIEAKLAWQQGMLVFRGSPLEEVLADVSRYTTVRFTIADDSIRGTRVGGYFRAGDIDALLLALRESFGIEPQWLGDEIVLTAQE